MTVTRVLLVDSSEESRGFLREKLDPRVLVSAAASIRDAEEHLAAEGSPDIVLTSHRLADGSGLQVMGVVAGYWPPVPVVYMVEPGDEKEAAAALQQGAADFLVKGSTETLRLFQILTNVLARSRAELAAQQRAREMGVLNAILTALNQESDEQPVLDAVVQEVHALMGTDACSVIMIDEQADRMTVRASTRLPVRDMALPVPLGKSIAGRVVREKVGCITHDVNQDPDWHSLNVDHLIPTPVRSMLTVPLMSGDTPIGVLQAINKQVGPFLPTDLTLMDSIAAIATVAIVRGHRYSELESGLSGTAEAKASMLQAAEGLAAALEKQATSNPDADLDPVLGMARQLVQLASG